MGHKKTMIKYFNELARKHSLWNVFTDFCEMSALAIANSVDWAQYDRREKRYMEIVKKYTKEEANKIASILAELTLALQEEPTDVLGEIFMELELGNKWKGQFFTPMSVSKMMADITIADLPEEAVKEYGYFTVSEPAVGGGANIIALALAMKDKGLNYQKQMLVTATDVDIRAVHMAFIQFSLLGIPAVVIHGNTLTVEEWEHWKTPFYVIHGWESRYREDNKKKKVLRLNSKIRNAVKKVERNLTA